ncbi:hypothetical protein K505DRAFT_72449 [Melanomma pulvis-pyrius CBS 109.77]|uniref:Uncharacterized protein n=1 Tax=Melanomma pulvis-pyrius CBS 109.77 TaxID=1314802 RepID=A0A6A6X424_9PLEO|nr:hypothetical protein K505DRAFT_72449 [Melanomma pulvis-pyrius CBS 109.77]
MIVMRMNVGCGDFCHFSSYLFINLASLATIFPPLSPKSHSRGLLPLCGLRFQRRWSYIAFAYPGGF